MIYSYEFDFLIFERNYNLMLNKSTLSERDICTKYITPALEKAGWDKNLQILEEVGFTNGRIYVRGKLTARGKRKRADYILYYKTNIPIAIIEAKDNELNRDLIFTRSSQDNNSGNTPNRVTFFDITGPWR